MNNKELEEKRNHHYVWANYLKRWSINNRDIYYTTNKGKIAFDSVVGLARQRDFYKIKPINNFQLELIKNLSKQASEVIQEEHKRNFSMFYNIQRLEELYKLVGYKNIEAEKAINVLKSNLLEDFHGIFERNSKPILDELAKGNLKVLDKDNNMITFMSFLGHQFARTKSFKDTSILASSYVSSDNEELNFRFKQETENVWWFLSYMYGTNIGSGLYISRNKENHSLILNNTSIPFITSDQPLVNVHCNLSDDIFQPPSEMEFDLYYPISPKYAYFISASHRFERGIIEIDEKIVIELNTKLSKFAISYIFSDRKDILEDYKNLIGKNFKKAYGHFERKISKN